MTSKSLVNPSFLVLMLDVQEHLKAGWEIDPNNLPSNNFVYYEVHLIKDDYAEMSEVFQTEEKIIVPPVKKAGRPPQNKAAH